MALHSTFVFNPFADTHAGADYKQLRHLCATLPPVSFGFFVSRGDTPLAVLTNWRHDALCTCGKSEDCVCCAAKHWRRVLVSGAGPSATTLAACFGDEKAHGFIQSRAFKIMCETDEHAAEEARANFAISVCASVLHCISPTRMKRSTSRPWRHVAKTHTLPDAMPQCIRLQTRNALRWASSRTVVVASESEARTTVLVRRTEYISAHAGHGMRSRQRRLLLAMILQLGLISVLR